MQKNNTRRLTESAIMVALAAIPAAVAGGVLLALVQRVREIGRRELDEARQF